MKSMSISAQGRSRLNWVWRWSNGLVSTESPLIHIRAGEKVCIQAITPTQLFEALASRQAAAMPSGVLTTGRYTTRTGMAGAPSSAAAMASELTATCRSVSSPYRSWLPVRNQTSNSPSAFNLITPNYVTSDDPKPPETTYSAVDDERS